jgi:hypothetical protein
LAPVRIPDELVGDCQQRRWFQDAGEITPGPGGRGDRLPDPGRPLVVGKFQAMDSPIGAALGAAASGDDQVHSSVRTVDERDRDAPQRSSRQVTGDGVGRCVHQDRRDAGIGNRAQRPR